MLPPLSTPLQPSFQHFFSSPLGYGHRANWVEPPLSSFRNASTYVSPEPSPAAPAPVAPRPTTPLQEVHPHPPFPALLRRSETEPRLSLSHPHPLGGEYFSGAHMATRETDPFFNPVLPPLAAQPFVGGRKKDKGGKKADGKQATFLTKLYGILERPEYREIIRWDDKGEVIVIEKPDELADKVLPLVYRQSRFASFSRQLNIYGWMRKVSLRHVEKGIVDPDASTWSHPFLRRDSTRDEIINFKRRVPPRPSQANRRRASENSVPVLNEETLSPSSGSDDNYHSPPDPYRNHLIDDMGDDHRLYPHMHGRSLSYSYGYGDHPYGYSASNSMPFNIHSRSLSDSSMEIDQTHTQSQSPTQAPAPTQALVDPHVQLSSPFEGISKQDPNQIPTRPIPVPLQMSTPLTSGYTTVPSSAPVPADPFPGMRIHQSHFRTRSVQGDPPSASFHNSPGSPLAMSWIPADTAPTQFQLDMGNSDGIPIPASSQGGVLIPTIENQAQAQAQDHTPPVLRASYDPNDATTWAKRGFMDFNGNPMPGPSSLPSDFNSVLTMHSRAGGGHMHLPSHSFSSAMSVSVSASADGIGHMPPVVPPVPNTVSPGVYQAGFTPPDHTPKHPLQHPHPHPHQRLFYDVPPPIHIHPETAPESAPRMYIGGPDPERKASIPISPYSAKGRALVHPTAAPRTIASRRGSLTAEAISPIEPGTRQNGIKGDDEGLPSAGLKGFPTRLPFEAMMMEEER